MRFQRSSFSTFSSQLLYRSSGRRPTSTRPSSVGVLVLVTVLAHASSLRAQARTDEAESKTTAASSQEAPAPPQVRATIVVTADRTPESVDELTDSVTVITADELRQSQRATLADALRDVAGVSIIQSGSAGHTTAAFVRGASPAQLLVLVDGMEVNNPFFGSVDLSPFLTSGVERVEILRGPQSPLYGSEAMAGVMNIITGRSLERGGTGEASFEGGSHSTYREDVQLGRQQGPLQWSLTGGRHDSDGQFSNDEFRDTQITGRVRRELGTKAVLTVHGFLTDENTGIPFNGEEPSPRRDIASTVGVAGATYDLHASAHLDLDLRASFTHREDDFRDPEDLFSQASSDRSLLWRASAQNTARFGGHTLIVGLEHRNEDVTASNNGEAALDEGFHTTSVYAQDKVKLGDLVASFGGRLDHHDAFGNHFSQRVSAAYRLTSAWRVRGAFGSAFRSPSAGELAYPFYGNPDLSPETSVSYEAGGDFSSDKGDVSLTAFSSRYRDLISFDPVTFVAANIDRARTRGVEVMGATRLSKRWGVRGAYTYLWTRDNATDLPLFRRPANTGSITLAYDADAWGASGSARLVGRRFETDFSSGLNRYNSGYAKADTAAYYRIRPSLKLTARVDNVFDRRYAEALSFPAPGRTVHAGFSLGF